MTASSIVTELSCFNSNGSANKLCPEDRSVHDWYRFVLSFPPHLVRYYVERFKLTESAMVLDPFCGTGTTPVECKKLGLQSIGSEANPMAHFAAQVKTDWSPDPKGLLEHSLEIAHITQKELESQGIPDDTLPLFNRQGSIQPAELKTLPNDQMQLLLKDSISPRPLHKCIVLLNNLEQHRNEHYYPHQLLALAKSIVVSSSNLHFGPEVGVGKIKSDAPVVAPWFTVIQNMAQDLQSLATRNTIPSKILQVDSRGLGEHLLKDSIDAVITSPPYPNEKDYTRTTRLEAVLLGFIKNRTELQALKRGLVCSNTRSVYKDDTDDLCISSIEAVQQIARQIEERRVALGKTSGFERMYHRVTKLYFGGMFRHFSSLRECLRPGAFLAYVVGDQASYLRILIRTGKILVTIAESLGYEHIRTDLFRTRLATATGDQLREEVVILRWPG